ncbi:MAG TPA: hypothetical protein VLC55_11380, partial [Burkholderiales bacterium]|nr:hypothetical protein [Burkholderiales bacterium]
MRRDAPRRAGPGTLPGAAPASEMHSAVIGGREIPYTLVRCRRRSIGLKVDGDGLTVRMPLRASRGWLQSALEEHAAWILSKLEEWSRRPGRFPAWSACGIFPLLGR